MEEQIESKVKGEFLFHSEEVQAIIEKMPTRGAVYVIASTILLVVIILISSIVIKYPDTVNGQISITSHLAPIKLIANTSGKLHLLYENRVWVSEGEVIAYIDNEANYKDVLLIDSLLGRYDIQNLESFPVLSEVILGEISSAFNTFMIAHTQYCRMLHSDIYKIMCNNLRTQNLINTEIIRNLDRELLLKEQKINIERELLGRVP